MGARGLRMDVTDRRRLVTTLCIFGNAALLTDSLNLSRAGLLDDASEGREDPERVEFVMSSGGSISSNVFGIISAGGVMGDSSSSAVICSEACDDIYTLRRLTRGKGLGSRSLEYRSRLWQGLHRTVLHAWFSLV